MGAEIIPNAYTPPNTSEPSQGVFEGIRAMLRTHLREVYPLVYLDDASLVSWGSPHMAPELRAHALFQLSTSPEAFRVRMLGTDKRRVLMVLGGACNVYRSAPAVLEPFTAQRDPTLNALAWLGLPPTAHPSLPDELASILKLPKDTVQHALLAIPRHENLRDCLRTDPVTMFSSLAVAGVIFGLTLKGQDSRAV